MKTLKISMLLIAIVTLLCNCGHHEDESINKTKKYSGRELFESIFFGVGEFATKIPQLKTKTNLINDLEKEEKVDVMRKLRILSNEISSKHPNFFNDFKRQIESGNHQEVQFAMEQASYMIRDNVEIIFPGFNNVYNKVKADIHNGELKLENKDSVNSYLSSFQKSFDEKKYNNLLHENMIANKSAVVPCTWAVVCAAYFALAVHNTVAATALIYFKVAFYGPSMDGIIEKVPDDEEIEPRPRPTEEPDFFISNENDANLKTEILINEISNYYEQ